MNYYQIVPIAKLSLKAKPFFTYHSFRKIPKNTLVEVPFGKKRLKGLVIKTASKPTFKTRAVLSIIEKKPLTKNQLLLAEKIADYYLINLGSALGLFVSNTSKKTKKGQPLKSFKAPKTKIPTLTPSQKTAYEKISKSLQLETLLQGPASSGKTEVIMKLVGDLVKKKQQSLIIIPEIFLSYQEIARYQKRFAGKNVALLHSAIKPSEISTLWENCRTGKIDIIVSTKIGLFLPFKKLGLIVIDEEQDLSHKQWGSSPRYHTRIIATYLSEIFKAKLIHVSATPALETVHKFSNQKIKQNLIKLPMLKKGKLVVKKPNFDLVDARKHFFQKNRGGTFFKETLQTLEANVKNGRLSFVLIPRRGKSRITICDDCKKILTCQKCNSPLVQIGDDYRCLHCSYKKSGFSRCENCGSYRLKNIGVGTEKALHELQTVFPKARIRRADQTIFSKNRLRENLLKDLVGNKVDILIGTQAIVKGFDFPNLSLAVIAGAESWSGKIDYKYEERWLGNLFQLAGRVNRPGSDQKGKIIIQTYNTNNPLYEFLLNWDWDKFAKEELESRKSLKYPPYIKLIKLTYRNPSLKRVEKCVKNRYNEVLKMGLIVLVPYWGFSKKNQRNFQKNILLKVESSQDQTIKKLISALEEGWTVDIDPENIF